MVPLNLTTMNTIMPSMSIQEALSVICSNLNHEIRRQMPDEADGWASFHWAYANSIAQLFIVPTREIGTSFEVRQADDPPIDPDFLRLFNVSSGSATYTPAFGWIFNNVWDRRDLYIHASFVNYTSFGYLGRDGEFYPKPSKIYDFAWQPMQFYFQVSFDGMSPVALPYENFEVELSFIIDTKKYQSQ
jgi:hypothetical protein